MNKSLLLLAISLLVGFIPRASAQYPGWQHSGSLAILTTPEGANLPATATEEGFPLLVRLNKDWFDFSQAKANGDDIRFASDAGTPLAYEIDEWDAAAGTASIWVRIPTIKGNARQEIKMFWGKADAKGESDGKAVFNNSNSYVSVWHLDNSNNFVDSTTRANTARNDRSTTAQGIIGKCAEFYGGAKVYMPPAVLSGIVGNATFSFWAQVTTNRILPKGGANTVFSGLKTNGLVVNLRLPSQGVWWEFGDWGAFSGGRVDAFIQPINADELPGRWINWMFTHNSGSGIMNIYRDGALWATRTGANLTMGIPTGASLGLDVEGRVDEFKVAMTERSPNWIKLEYENQKPQQTMVGILPQPGTVFSVSHAVIAVDEGKTVTVTATAGGAQKTYWILKKDGVETLVAMDRFSYTLNAGRVTADTSYVLQFKAVYANEVKTKDIPVTVKETIPEPKVTLKAPAEWNGRDVIEAVLVIGNFKELKAKGVGELRKAWNVSGGAVIKEIAPDKLVLIRSQYTGPITVKATVNNGGADSVATAAIKVTEPKTDPWVQRIPERDEKPEEGQFYARDDHNEGTVYYNGTLDQAANEVFLKLYADDKLIKTETQKPSAKNAYAFTVKIKAGLIKYKVEFGTKTDGAETVLQTVGNLVCGDAYLIDGQSNALALDTGEQSPNVTNEWIRSYGGPGGRGDETSWARERFVNGKRENLWCSPFWRGPNKAALGWWGMELAQRLLESQKVPICMIQAAEGGTRIDEHMRNETDHVNLKTLYGHMLWRLRNARLTHGIRAVLWHQGEADQGSDGPDNGYGWVTYQRYFLDMSAAWKQDMPNIRHYYVFQIWPNGCSQGNGHGDMLREVQRTLPRLYSNLDVMSTLGIKPGGGCHYPLVGWSEFARLMQPLIERDFYGKAPAAPITAPNLKQAYYANSVKDAIALEFDQPVVWIDSLITEFYLDGAKGMVVSGRASGKVVTLKLKEASAAQKITYLKEMSWNPDNPLRGENGIAALTFCDVPILPVKPTN